MNLFICIQTLLYLCPIGCLSLAETANLVKPLIYIVHETRQNIMHKNETLLKVTVFFNWAGLAELISW